MEELDRLEGRTTWKTFLPAVLVLVGSFAMLGLRLQIGASFISDGALMMLALASYIFAALFQLTNLYAPSSMAEKIGMFTAALGVFFNLSSWLVRWVNAYQHEIAEMHAGAGIDSPVLEPRRVPDRRGLETERRHVRVDLHFQLDAPVEAAARSRARRGRECEPRARDRIRRLVEDARVDHGGGTSFGR